VVIVKKYIGTAKKQIAAARYWLFALRSPAIREQPSFGIQPGTVFGVWPTASLSLGRGLTLGRDFNALVSGELRVGTNVFFNRGCHIVCRERVEIGDDCMFGERVSIHDANHQMSPEVIRKSQPAVNAPVRIGRNVWVGANAVITGGVTIGDNAVIGAGAVVTRDVPDQHLALGVPARSRPLDS
jgi:acetyltransferase-like isoleucine patch superfamily enzyme